MRLRGKRALVTGASRSIGQAIAIAFAKEGADVCVSYRSDEQGARNTVQIIERCGQRGKALYADFSQADSVQKFVEESLDFLGSIDLLVNNAAGYDTTDFLRIHREDFQHLLQVGVTTPMVLTQMVATHMIEQAISGSIINISSISGVRPYPNRVAFATMKAALNMLTQTTALELGKHRIRVNAIAPGSTPYEENGAENPDAIPLLRWGRAEDHASAAVFLASEESSWMTGQVLVIDGGQSLAF